MDGTAKILKYGIRDILRSRWIIGYGVFFLVLTHVLFQFGGSDARVISSLMNVVFILVPLVCILFGTMYLYQSREFIELLLCQPVPRRAIFFGLYIGLVVPLAVCFAAGVGAPFWLFGFTQGGVLLTLMISGVALTLVFTGLAVWIVTAQDDRARGFGMALVIWFFLAVVYDGLILLVVYAFGDYPIEYPVIGLTMLNPVDLVRILMLTKLDVAAMLGYTGAVFTQFFGQATGAWVTGGTLVAWSVVPCLLALRQFMRRDF